MKLTNNQLKQIIKEELGKVLNEMYGDENYGIDIGNPDQLSTGKRGYNVRTANNVATIPEFDGKYDNLEKLIIDLENSGLPGDILIGSWSKQATLKDIIASKGLPDPSLGRDAASIEDHDDDWME